MLRRVHAYWSANKPGHKKKVDAEEHLNYKDGEYMMFRELRGEISPKTRAKRLVWVDGKFIKFQFKRFNLGDTYNDVVNIPLDKDEGLKELRRDGHLRASKSRQDSAAADEGLVPRAVLPAV